MPLRSESLKKGSYILVRKFLISITDPALCALAKFRKILWLRIRIRKACAMFQRILVAVRATIRDSLVARCELSANMLGCWV